ncbi:Ribulose bisphosphate carboxylase small chain, chloroplastic [Panicum miliaceum]|uniref:Ribulose bisphosphate carboxylase small chain, chloroplastic n=1 Tax=Panicum miliaceum TaxID=4540 RepID=A0A3L6T693_PANMI|nr:Ribulose bisphosphate carboxylase small chain, chloroplastic [Panicum miliaceum]
MAPSVMASSATSVAPFQGLIKSTAGLPYQPPLQQLRLRQRQQRRKDQLWPIEGVKKFENLSYQYLPPLSFY